MRIATFTLFLASLIIATSCIENDIPYPTVRGKITEIEFNGQKSVTIDEENLVVNVELLDTTDIQNVLLTKFKTTENTTVTPSIDFLPLVMDLRSDHNFQLSTYQKYNWIIKTTQPVDREANVNGQVGDAKFDPANKIAIIYVSRSTDRANITVNSLTFESPINSTVSPDPKTIHDFSLPIEFTVRQHERSEIWTLYVLTAQLDIKTNEPEVWAKRAILSGSIVVKEGVEVGIRYKKTGDSDYTTLKGSDVEVRGGTITATIKTDPDTKYSYHVYQGEDNAMDVAFLTEAAPTIPNLSLDTWCSRSSSNGPVWYPCADGELTVSGTKYASPFWDTSNEGVTIYGTSNIYPVEDAVSGKAAYLETRGSVPLVGMASGSLFIGDFDTNLLNPIESPKFGRPFTARPTRLTGKYKYIPQKITVSDPKKYPDMVQYSGQLDRCHLWVRLENRDGAKIVTIAEGSFVEYGTVNQYKDFTIEFNYKIKDQKPTHLLIVMASSYFGDYYTGGIGTKLYVDELDLVY